MADYKFITLCLDYCYRYSIITEKAFGQAVGEYWKLGMYPSELFCPAKRRNFVRYVEYRYMRMILPQ